MPSPLMVLGAPFALAIFVFLLRRWPRVASIAGAISLLALALAMTRLDLDPTTEVVVSGFIRGDTWQVLGREIALTAAIRSILLFTYGLLVVVFLINFVLPQDSLFIPLSLAVLSPLAGALMVRPTVFGAVLLLIAAGLLALMIQGIRAGSTLAAFRYLTMMAIATPMLLIAGWIQETEQIPLFGTVSALYMVAFVILLAGFPFQIWIAPLISESQSLVPTVIVGLVQMIVVAFCIILLLGSPATQGSAQFWGGIRLSGALVLVIGSLFCLTARSFGRLLGYLVIINIGILVLAFSFLDRTRPELIMTLLIARVPGLLLAGFGLGLLNYQLGARFDNKDFTKTVRRLAWIAPVGLALFVYGGFSLLGVPFTVGFQGHWTTIDLASTQSFWLAALIVLSITAGAAKLLQLLVDSLRHDSAMAEAEKGLTTEMKWAAGLLVGLVTLATFFPQFIVDLARQMIELI